MKELFIAVVFFIGAVFGLLVALDGYVRGKLMIPVKEDGTPHKLKVTLMYLTFMIFSGFVALIIVKTFLFFYPAFASDLVVLCIIAGVSGAMGRDLFFAIVDKFRDKIEHTLDDIEERL